MRTVCLASTLTVLTVVALTGALTVGAAGSTYGEWSGGGLSVDAGDFPAAAVSSTASQTAPASSAFLNGSTPFGTQFGSSKGANYLNVSTAPGATPSTTVISFESSTPASG